MGKNLCTVITGTGSYIPETEIPNDYFKEHEFYELNKETGKPIKVKDMPEKTIETLGNITGIAKRRYLTDSRCTSDIGYEAAQMCLKNSGTNPEELDYIIFAHNFGDIKFGGVIKEGIDYGNTRIHQVPSLAIKVKGKLGIKNRKTECVDLLFGCPGWLQGIITAHRNFQGGFGKKALVIGAETLSRVSDPHDRDSMIYADGAGATLVEAVESEEAKGVLSFAIDCSDSTTHNIMKMGETYGEENNERLYFKMYGREVYKHAVRFVPKVVRESLKGAGLSLEDIKKILIHQANHKLDYAIVKTLIQDATKEKNERIEREELDEKIKSIMPMTISDLGNTSVATIPTLLDLLMRKKLNNHELESGDNIVFASIGGGGPNINSVVYRMP